jgi:hypothetical protein
MDDEDYSGDDEFSSSYCPLYPVIRFPCCEISFGSIFTDLLTTMPIFVGVLGIYWLCHELFVRVRDAKLHKEGERIKGIVSEKKHTTSKSETHGTTQHHFEVTIKYPAEGATLQSPECYRIVTKTLSVNYQVFNELNEIIPSDDNGIGGMPEVDLLRMKAPSDPRQAVLLSVISNRWSCWLLLPMSLVCILWICVWSSIGCLACIWSLSLGVFFAPCCILCGIDTKGNEKCNISDNPDKDEREIDQSAKQPPTKSSLEIGVLT